jgi:hypothetical protein
MGHLHWLHMKCYKTISFKESNTSHIVTAVITNDSLAVYQKKKEFIRMCHLMANINFCVVCVFTFGVPCCDARYDFSIKTMFVSSPPPVVCRKVHVLFE